MVYRKLLLKVFLMDMHMRGDMQLGEEIVLFKKIERNHDRLVFWKETDNLPQIICLYAQFRPGKTNSTYSYPKDYPDQKSDRLRYFEDEGVKIAVPYGIGCGLAG